MNPLSGRLARWLDGWRTNHGLEPPAAAVRGGDARWLLHVGCGGADKRSAGPGFQGEDWIEIRLDIDADAAPDVVASMLDMHAVPDESVDAVYSSHNIEHLYPHEVPRALAEFARVLKPDGFLVVRCPDLEAVCRLVADGAAEQPAYVSPAGPITPLDMLFGHGPQLAAGNHFMGHRYGFTMATLAGHIKAAGFPALIVMKRENLFELACVASRRQIDEDRLRHLAAEFIPA